MPSSAAASAMNNVRSGTVPPSFSPLSTFSPCRIRTGNIGLDTTA
jgi:hypothetical protein